MYQIDWKREAEQELAAIWLAAPDRNAITFASATIDSILERQPLDVGESRTSSIHRVVFYRPLFVEYSVIEDDKKVIVQHVKSAIS